MDSKWRNISLYKKLNVLEGIKRNEPRNKIAQLFKIARAQVGNIARNADKIEEEWRITQNMKSKGQKKKYDDVDDAVFQWLRLELIKGAVIDDATIIQKAREIGRCLGVPEAFLPSRRWLFRFKVGNSWKLNTQLDDENAKKGGKSASSEQNNESPVGNEEVIVPDVEMRCSETESQSGSSTSLMSHSAIVVKQEIIETEQESSSFDDSSFHSPFVDGSTENPSASFFIHSESSNSNADIHPVGQTRDVVMTPTLSPSLSIVKVESDISTNFCDKSSEKDVTFSNVPPALNITVPESSSSTLPIQSEVTSRRESPSLSQAPKISNLESSGNNEPIHPGVPSNLSPPLPPRDKFDAYGEFIASKLRNLDSKSCTFVQTAFADLMFKAELGMFLNGGEKHSISAFRANDAGKDTLPHNQSESACNSSGKENVQPRAPSHTGSPHLPPTSNTTDSESSPRNEFLQPRVPAHVPNQLFPPVLTNIAPESSLINESYQPRITSHIENQYPPVSNVTIPNNPSVHNPLQTRVSSHIGPPPVLNHTNSWTNIPVQSRVPFHMRPRDEFDSYGEFAASKLRNLDPRSCAFVQTAFADLIFEAELGRFLSEGERSIFANKTNEILRNMPPANVSELSSLRNVVSNLARYEAEPQLNFAPTGFYAGQVPLELIPNLHAVPK